MIPTTDRSLDGYSVNLQSTSVSQLLRVRSFEFTNNLRKTRLDRFIECPMVVSKELHLCDVAWGRLGLRLIQLKQLEGAEIGYAWLGIVGFNVFTHPDDGALAKQQRESALPLATGDREQVKAAEGSSGSRSANDEVQLGMALVSFGEHLRGAEALARRISQGGIKQPDQAQLILGQALVKLNRVQEAKAASDSVDASSKLKTVVRLWSAYTAPLPPQK